MILSLQMSWIRLFLQDITDWPTSESDVLLTCLLFQEDSWEEDQFEDMVKQVKESLKEQDKSLSREANSMNLLN